MAVYNGMPYLPQAVDSVLAQTYKDFEFIIVDDGSKDETPAVLAECARREPRIRVLTHPSNQGGAAALVTGVGTARGEFIARIDADDEYLPERLQKMVDFLDRTPGVAAVGTWFLLVDMDGRPVAKGQPPTDPAAIRRGLALRNCMGVGVLMRKGALVKVGNYRPGFRSTEDYDLWLRMAEQYDLAALPEHLYLYRRRPGAKTVQHIRTSCAYASLARKFARQRKRTGADSYAEYVAAGRFPKMNTEGADLGPYFCDLAKKAIDRERYAQGWHLAVKAVQCEPRCAFRALLLILRIPLVRMKLLRTMKDLLRRD